MSIKRKLKQGEEYYRITIDSYGIHVDPMRYERDAFDKRLMAQGNFFQVEADAEKIVIELKKVFRKNN